LGNPLDAPTVRSLRDRFGDALSTPTDDGYDQARAVWNGRFDRKPGAIVRCTSADDVAAALAIARDHGLRVTVRSGGHDYAGNSSCDGGLVIDLSRMKRIEVDADRRRARVQPGVLWGELDAAAAAHGLWTAGGTVSTVGVAGFTLGGGSGWMSRRYGMAVDNLVAAEVVLASGERSRASETENEDLLWALRGAGANVGVVTELELRLYEMRDPVLSGQIVHPHSAAREVMRGYQEVMAAAPDELGCYLFFYRAPAVEPFPPVLHGKTVVALAAAWTGDPAAGNSALAPLRAIGEPVLDLIGPLPYLELQKSFDAGMPKGNRWCSRAGYLRELSDAAIDLFADRTQELCGDFTMVYLDPGGGAIGRVAPDATAFPHREAPFGFHVFPGWVNAADDDANISWANGFLSDLAPFSAAGVYVNMLGGEEPERVPEAYLDNYARLRELKRRFDPDNLFRSNHNVPPAD